MTDEQRRAIMARLADGVKKHGEAFGGLYLAAVEATKGDLAAAIDAAEKAAAEGFTAPEGEDTPEDYEAVFGGES